LFYLFKRNINIDDYLLGRLFDTLVGLFIGACCEVLVLPRSYINQLRSNLSMVYRDWWFLMMLIKNPHDLADLKDLISDINERVVAAETYMQGIKNEPLIMINRRYRYFKKLPAQLKTLSDVIAKTSLKEMSPATIAFAQDFFGGLREIYSQSEEDRKRLFVKYNETLPGLIEGANRNGKQLLLAIDAVLKIYQQMYAVKRYRFRWLYPK